MACYKGKKNPSKFLVEEKPEGNRPLERWKDNYKSVLKQ
jgi:hypothetical protein